MFGNVPRALWKRWLPPDEHNRIPLACRTLLIDDDGKLILFETGIGAFFTPKLRERFGVIESEHMLLQNLRVAGFSHADIDVVVLSHLHFDHAGGLLARLKEGRGHRLLFPNARFVTSRVAYERAVTPHVRDRASFIPIVPALLEGSGRLELVDGEFCDTLGDDYRFHYSEGHTPGLMLSEISSDDGPIVFATDLIPGVPWVHLPITMGYDRYPEKLIDEKGKLLEDLLSRNGRLYFTHDHDTALARVVRDERGRFGVADALATLDGLTV